MGLETFRYHAICCESSASCGWDLPAEIMLNAIWPFLKLVHCYFFVNFKRSSYFARLFQNTYVVFVKFGGFSKTKRVFIACYLHSITNSAPTFLTSSEQRSGSIYDVGPTHKRTPDLHQLSTSCNTSCHFWPNILPQPLQTSQSQLRTLLSFPDFSQRRCGISKFEEKKTKVKIQKSKIFI